MLEYLFLIFFLYSVLGYLVEIINCSIIEKKVVLNRGFCLGPYLPIYGISSVIMRIFLDRYQDDLFVLFVMAAFICTIMEFITSYILEAIFHTRWWDYHNKKFNIDGRVCLSNSILFGLGGVFIIKVLSPIVDKIVMFLLPYKIITFLLFLCFLFDVIITLVTLSELKIAERKFTKLDATEEISKLVREHLVRNRLLVRRMLNAFPNFDRNKDFDPLSKIKESLNNMKKNNVK